MRFIILAAALTAIPAYADNLDDALDASVLCRSEIAQEREDALHDLGDILARATAELNPLSPDNDDQLRHHETIRRLTTDCLERAF